MEAASNRDSASPDAFVPPLAIVLVGPLPPPPGGMANQTRQLAKLLADERCEVTVVQVNAPYRPAWIAPIWGIRAAFRLLSYVRKLRSAIGRADLVHVMANSGWAWHLFAAPAVWIGWARSVPVIVNYRGGDADAFFSRQFRCVRPTLARARAVAVPSGFLKDVFARFEIVTIIVPNIVDLEAFHPADTIPSMPHLIVTRNLEPIYDIGTAIRAFAVVIGRYPDASMTIAGSGPDRDMLENLAEELGVANRIRFTGRLDNCELPDLYRSASVVVNASLVDNLPIALLEAMASGVPIVSTDVGGIPHMVENGATALLVPPRAPTAMGNAILSLLDDRELAQRLRHAGIEAARRYAWPEVRPVLFDVYAGALGRRPIDCRGAERAVTR